MTQIVRDHEDIRFYDGEHKIKLDSLFGIFKERVEVLQEKYILPASYRNWYQKYKDFEARADDIWVISYPRSGTTWTQEMVWCIVHGFDYKADEDLMKRFPYFEFDGLMPLDTSIFDNLEEGDPCKPGETWKILQEVNNPRTIKSHLHLELLPNNIFSSGAKVVYVCRSPRDVCVSCFYHSVKYDGFVGDFQDFLDLFIKDLHFYSPYWKNVLDYWNIKDHPNLLFIRYEELHENLPGMIRKVADFLGRRVTDEFVDQLTSHLSFSSMSANKAVNGESLSVFDLAKTEIKFIRKGKVGDWKSHFTDKNEADFGKWMKDKLIGTDFPYYQDSS